MSEDADLTYIRLVGDTYKPLVDLVEGDEILAWDGDGNEIVTVFYGKVVSE